ncbi:NAD(P)/FAD-dependent oxidoreductase [uncultured Megasphaera sp.]|uniref:dihydrolipoyl dehydrogenase family protein n=1 Tax=uncultured Megasphaera sp. TaxID=165188 RepID=UPI0012E2AA38|nr:FAD-dependent oxidoreductase [uncultured Megasphaera sp.]MUP58500.1 dihydrolipoamide dehydrogenase [Veillonellaceae bacterium M2-4]
MKQYDVIIIGTGAANIIADAAIAGGKSVAIIERGRFGGTCLNRGCIPTKILVTAANRIREMAESARLGIYTEKITVDWDLLSKRLWHKIQESDEIRTYYDAFPHVTTYQGTASFTDDKTITITYENETTERITGTSIFIATGGRTNIPAVEGLKDVGYLTSETFFGDAYPQKPYKSLIILGGGPIGCEFAHVFNALGTKVTVVQHNVRLLPKEDEAVSAHMLTQFQQYGIDVRLNQDTLSVEMENGEKVVTCSDRTSGEITTVRAEEILVAPGIKPMTELLHLENTHVQLDKRGYIRTNEFLETTAPGIWALGDINGKAPFRHKANYEAETLAHNLFSNKAPEEWRWVRYDAIPAVTYTYPEAAHIGMNEKAARNAGYEVEIAINHYSSTAKGYALGFMPNASDDGFVKLVIDSKQKKILGVHIVGVEASILIQPFCNLFYCGRQHLQISEPDICSDITKKLRALPLTRHLPPRSVYTLSETMTPHPALSELTMWTRYYYEKK